MRNPSLSRLSFAAATALALLVSGCAAGQGAATPPAESTAAATDSASATNCGFDVPLGGAPERIVSVKSSSTDLLVALGLADRIVAVASQDAPLPKEVTAQDFGFGMPSQEAVLAVEPDAVFAGWESAFADDALGDRASLERLGILTYVAPAACRSVDVPTGVTWETLFSAFQEAGDVFGARDAADELVEQQRAQLERVAPITTETTALWWSSAKDTPYVGAGGGAPQLVMDTAGLTNIAAGEDAAWTSMGWEAIAEANPDVIVLVDADWNTAESKIEYLESNPLTQTLDAVVHGRYVTVPFPASEAGVGSLGAAQSLIDQLHDAGIR